MGRGGAATGRAAAAMGLAVAALAMTACAPVISHGPRVRDGMGAGISTAVMQRASGDGGGEQVVVPWISVGDSRGDAVGGTQVTIQAMLVPEGGAEQLHPGLFQLDYYRQRPSTNPAVPSGWGVHGSLFHIMPYQQIGVYTEGLGIYTTQGIGFAGGPLLGLPPEAVFWSPGFGVEFDIASQVTLRMTMSAMFAHSLGAGDGPDFEDPPISLGFGLELGSPRGALSGRGARE